MPNLLSRSVPSIKYVDSFITVLPWHYSSIPQGTWIVTIHSSNIHNLHFMNDSNTINDAVTYNISLSRGIYTFTLYHSKGSARGILTLLINGISAGTIDFYDPSTTWNDKSSISNIVIPSLSYYNVTFKAASKNPASSYYYLPINSFSFTKQ